MTSQERYEKGVEIVAFLGTLPLEQRQQALNDRLNAEIDDEYDRRLLFLVIATQIQITRESVLKQVALWEKIIAAAAGFAFLVTILIIVLVIPQPTEPQIFVFRLILAIAAAAFAGALIPGLLEVQGKFKRLTVRAGGAIAVFVIVYLMNPPALVHH
jgi:anti-sigma-K factor RskA